MKILILCTGNSCRSQMAEGILRSIAPSLEVFSAGTQPERQVNPYAVIVMKEAGIDISRQYPKSVEEFVGMDLDYVITVCDNANESCPAFLGKVRHRLHIGFDDPAKARGSDREILEVYRKSRDRIAEAFNRLYQEVLIQQA